MLCSEEEGTGTTVRSKLKTTVTAIITKLNPRAANVSEKSTFTKYAKIISDFMIWLNLWHPLCWKQVPLRAPGNEVSYFQL